MENVKPCIRNFLEASRRCMRRESNSSDLDEPMRMIDAAIEFICHNGGDRIASE